MNQTMCVIGGGTVGRATMKTFNIEKFYSRSEHTITLAEAAACQYIFVCLPTPVTKKGEYFTDDIVALIQELVTYPGFRDAVVIIRSTVYPGFNRFLQNTCRITNIVSNPEFLSEDTWEQDAVRPDLVVIGADTPELRERVKGLYAGRFKYNNPIVTDSITAELLKISLNGFFTTKVVFANTVFNYAEKLGANYETIRTVLEGHPWGSRNHFVIHHKGGRGAGGKCLGKDMTALAEYADLPLFHVVDWENKTLLAITKKQ